ncbi:hypothetical protein CIW54_07160 [Paraburkholderia sp. T12-10]|nr:hypothetical protein CIW54_07160 [Paraburkholderia sp. T12-10]
MKTIGPVMNADPRTERSAPEASFAVARGGKIAHISEVDRGRACGCTCAACDRPVVAKQGARNAWHFAHDASGSCATAAETALHRAIKQVIAEGNVIGVPELIVEATATYNGHTKSAVRVLEQRRVSYSAPRLEVRMADIVGDAVVSVAGRDLIVEVAVTHRVDDEKRAKISQIGLSALELQAWCLARDADWDQLRAFVSDSSSNRIWLHNLREPVQRQLAQLDALRHAKNASRYFAALETERLATIAAATRRNNARKVEADGAAIEKFRHLWRKYKTSALLGVELDAKASGYVYRWSEKDADGDPALYFELLLDWICNGTRSTIREERTSSN